MSRCNTAAQHGRRLRPLAHRINNHEPPEFSSALAASDETISDQDALPSLAEMERAAS